MTERGRDILLHRGLWWCAYYRFRRNHAAMTGVLLLVTLIFLLVFIPLFSPFQHDVIDWEHYWLQPDFTSGHYFGTDVLGRDLLVRTAMGGRISLVVGIGSAVIAILVGMLYGATAGYFGEWVDAVMMRWLEILDSLPFIFFVISLASYFGCSLLVLFTAIGVFSWLNIARIVRGQTLSLKQKEFVLVARIYGYTPFSIILRHIAPNVLGLIIVYSSLLIPSMILFESFISFFGLSVQDPMVSCGALVQSGASTLEHTHWALIGPGSFLVLTILCFTLISDGLRDAFDPQC
jgi:oligopeptide transport system permease protein